MLPSFTCLELAWSQLQNSKRWFVKNNMNLKASSLLKTRPLRLQSSKTMLQSGRQKSIKYSSSIQRTQTFFDYLSSPRKKRKIYHRLNSQWEPRKPPITLGRDGMMKVNFVSSCYLKHVQNSVLTRTSTKSSKMKHCSSSGAITTKGPGNEQGQLQMRRVTKVYRNYLKRKILSKSIMKNISTRQGFLCRYL